MERRLAISAGAYCVFTFLLAARCGEVAICATIIPLAIVIFPVWIVLEVRERFL